MGRKLIIFVVAVCFAGAWPARAVKVGDITRLRGQQSNVLTGLGLVVGLPGTGDGGDYLPAIRPLATMLGRLNNHAAAPDLANVANVALVTVTAVLPPRGVTRGEAVDVYVTSVGPATSLKGGRLYLTPLVGPVRLPGATDDEVLALAQGQVVIEDPTTPTTAVVPRGAVMEVAFRPPVVNARGTLALILQDAAADWNTASTIAKVINDAEGNGQEIADVLDEKTVEVTIPEAERARPAGFIARLQRLPVPQPQAEARVLINERTGTIVLTGDVEISPCVISHRGLTIQTVAPAPVPTPRTPVTTERRAVALDTTKEGGAPLQDLVDAMDLIRVPVEDRIQIVKQLHKTGRLHAKLVIVGANE